MSGANEAATAGPVIAASILLRIACASPSETDHNLNSEFPESTQCERNFSVFFR